MKKYGLELALLAALGWLSGACRVAYRQPAWTAGNAAKPATAAEVADDLDADSLVLALDRTLARLALVAKPEDKIRFGPLAFSVGRLQASLADFRSRLLEMGLGPSFYEYVRSHYSFYRSAAKRVLFTGYYEPLLHGSLQPNPGFPHPLYRRPGDLVTVDLKLFSFYAEHPGLPGQVRGRIREDRHVVPYFSRQEIEQESRLAGKELEIVWVDDSVEVFFLQIQGSGIVELEDGERLRVGYADQNGHPYRSIGKLLLDSGVLERSQLSMQGIKRYLREHPERMEEVMSGNPSYVFFRFLENGPVGSFGAALTPLRSIATDRTLYPAGALVWIETEKPILEGGRILYWKKFGRFVLNQDTGGAIRGPDRVDLFCGSGADAELTAGSMRQEGMFFFLLKKDF